MPDNEQKNEKHISSRDVEHEFKTLKARPVELPDDYQYYNQNIFFKIFSSIFIILFWIFCDVLFARIFLGFRVRGKKNLKAAKKEGTVIIGNHVHPLDAILVGTTIFPSRIYVTMLMTNLGIPFIGRILRIAGGIPIPQTKIGLSKLLNETNDILKSGVMLLVMPEAILKPYHQGIRKFHNGGFRFAVNSGSSVLPAVFIYKKPGWFYSLFKKKPLIELHFLPTIPVVYKETSAETIKVLKTKVHDAMSEYYDKHSFKF